MSITLRNVKGSPLSHDEMDANFSVLTGSIDAGDGLSGGGVISGSIEFAVNATVARTGSNTFTGPQNIQSSLTASSAAITTVSGSSITYTSGSIDRIDTTAGNITTLTGTDLTYTSGSIDRIDSTSAGITTLSGSTATYTSGSIDRIDTTAGNITTLTGTDLTFTSGSIDRIDTTAGNITTLTGTDLTFTSASLDRIDSTAADITTLTGTDLTFTSGSLSRLDVSGNGEVQGDLNVGGTVTAQEFHTEYVSSSIIFTSGSTKFGDTLDDTHHFTGSVSITGSSTFTNHGPAYFLQGNVGIGTTSPSKNLHVYHATTNRPARIESGDSGAQIEFTDNSTTNLPAVGAIGNDFVIQTGGSAATRMLVDNSGNVGIGTTSPSEKLEVTGNTILDASNANLKIKAGVTGTKGDIQWTFNTDSTVYASAGIEYDNRGTDGFLIDSGYPITMDFASSYIRWRYNGSEKMRLNSSGNLGIGTTSPGQKLEVNGSIFANGGDITGSNFRVGEYIAHSGDSDTFIRLQDNDINLTANGQNLVRADGGTAVVINEGQNDVDFRVESNNNAYLLYANAGNNRIGILNSNPAATLDVNGDLNILGDSSLGNANSDRLDILGETIALSGSNTTIEHIAASGNLRIQSTGGTNNKLILSSSGDIEVEQSVTVKNLDTSIQSSGYQSGFAGQGFDINFGEQASAEFDNLTVRGSMRVFELIINQVRATNGSLFVSSTGKVDSVEDLGGGNFALLFDTGSGTVGHGFTENDVIRAQQVNRDAIAGAGQTQSLDDNLVFRSDLTVTSVQDLKIVTASLQAGSTPPSASFDFVRLGNSSNVNRQGNVYLTSDDNYAPFIDVVDGITSHSDWNNSATSGGVKVRVGKIDGINSPVFGDLTGYGMWASGSVYLEGSINATSGLIAGWAINPGVLQSNNIYIQSSGSAGGELIKIGQTAGMSGNGIFLSGSGDFNLQSDSSNFIRKSGTDIQVRSENFILNTAKLKIDSTAGGSGSIALGATPPENYNSGTGFFVDGSGKFLLGNSGGSKIQWDGTNLDVVGSITISNPEDIDISTINNDSGFTDDTAANAAQSTATAASASTATVSGSEAAIRTQVRLTATGMQLADQSNNILANYGTTTTIGRDANNQSRIFIDNNSVDLIVDSGGTDTTQASFGATTTVGSTASEHIKISGSGLELKDGSTRYIGISSTGMQIGSAANGITLDTSGNATFNGTITITGGDIAGLTSSLDSSISTAQSTANSANTAATNASASAATVGNDLTSVSQSFETTTATNTSASAAAQATAITAESNASTAQAAIDTMETQVVLNSGGMDLRKSDGSTNVVSYGTTTKFFDGVGDADANRKLQLNASGLIAFGDDTNTFAHVKSTGIQLVEDNTEVANFAATTTIGNTSTEHIRISGSGLEIKDGSTTRLSMNGSGMQIGSVANGITLDASGNATFNGSITLTGGDIAGLTSSLDSSITTAQNTANTANTSATNASASAASVGNDLTSVSQSFETTTATNTSASAAAQATAITAESNASTAQAAIDTMETQVVLNSGGMDLRKSDGSTNVVSYGTTTKFFDGVGDADANRKLQLNASGLIAFGDDTNTFAHVKSTGIQLVEDNTEVANFAATTTIGNTSTEHIRISGSGLEIKDGTTTRLSMNGSGMQIGSVANGITLDASGNATFNGEITISSGLAESISGSINGQTGSLDTAISEASASAAAGESGSNALHTQVVLNSNGMELKNAASNVTLASYGTTTTIGQDANDKSRIFIDNDSVDLIVDSSGTDTTFASFGATTTVGNTAAEHISIDSDSVDIIQDANNKAVVSSTGLDITQGGSNVASFGSSMRVGLDAADKTALRIDSSGNLSIGNSVDAPNFSADSSGNVTMTGTVSATAGDVGGFGISATSISSSNDNLILRSNGQITASNVDLTGKISATAGAIADFTIEETTLQLITGSTIIEMGGLTNNDAGDAGFNISGSNTYLDISAQRFSGTTFFPRIEMYDVENQAGMYAGIASSINTDFGAAVDEFNFVVLANGNEKIFSVGAENTFAGFDFNISQINSTNDNLILKANGQFTGSAALLNSPKITGTLTGGANATFSNITGANITGANITGSNGTYSGNLGVGTANPDTKMHVEGASFGGSITLKVENTGTGGNAQLDLTNDAQSWIVRTATDDKFNIYNNTSTTTPLAIDLNGNVGIGTTSPDTKLEIKESSNGAGDAVIRLRGHGNNADNTVLGALEWFNADSSGDSPSVVARIEGLSGNANGHMGELAFKTHDGSEGGEGSTAVERMRIDNSGNVGIGTTSPPEKLTIEGSVSASGDVQIGSGVNANAYGRLQVNQSSNVDEEGIAILSAAAGRSIRIYVDETNSYINSGNGGGGSIILNEGSGKIGIGLTSPGSRLHIKQSDNTYEGGLNLERSDTTASWSIFTNSSSDLNFNQGSSTRGYLDSGVNVGNIDFTGQHRSLLASNSPDISTPIEDLIGLIVIADGTYQNLSGGTAPKVNEALPNVKLSETANDIRVFGVISEKEDLTDNQRSYSLGNFVSVYETEASASERLVINSLGEGGMWVCNYSGSLANGNYITTSPIKGLGMKQESGILHNFTVAKITQDCNFDISGSYQEFTWSGSLYRKQFVGVTYHCG